MGLEDFTNEQLQAELSRRSDEAFRKERERQAGLVCGKCGGPYPTFQAAQSRRDNAYQASLWMGFPQTSMGIITTTEYRDGAAEGRYCERCNAVALHREENYQRAFHHLGYGDMRSTWKE